MARVWIARTYPDGEKVEIVVVAENAYPDSLDQARAVAMRGFSEAIGATEATWGTAIDVEEGD